MAAITVPIQIEAWYHALGWTVAALAGGFVLLVVFYAMGERLRVLVDIERNTRPPNVAGKRYWALPLMGFVCDLLGLILLIASLGVVAVIWLIFAGLIGGGPAATTLPAPG